jgi:hypothetical protein
MAYTNDTPIKPAARRRFETALSSYRQALPMHLTAPRPPVIPQPPQADPVSFVTAQAGAREWADKALDLGQVGDTEQARHARFRAEAWLGKMLAIEEAQDGTRERHELPVARPRARRRSLPGETRDANLNNSALRSWPRLRLHA